MANSIPPLSQLLRQLAPDSGSVADSELLRRYAEQRDEAAFELLLWRHGGMVWGVCQRIAPDLGGAEDAYQATAFALARNANKVRTASSLAGWLYRVAYRAALAVRSRRREELFAGIPDRPAPEPGPADAAESAELAGVIDAELSRLPDTFRLPFVMCELEGRSNAEAAAVLGCPVGTVESRLTRARARLRDRLVRRGVTLPVGVLAGSQVPASVQAAALRAAADPASAPAPLRELAARAAGAAGRGHLRAAAGILAALTALAVGLGVATEPRPPAAPPIPQAVQGLAPAPPLPAEFARLGSSRFRHPEPVFHVAFAPDGKSLATAALGSISIWETGTGKLLRRISRVGAPFHRVAFAAGGKTLYAIVGPTEDGCELLTLDPKTGQQRSRVVIRKKIYGGAEFSPDATRLAVFFMWGSAETVLMDPAAGKELATVSAQRRGNGFTPDGKRLVLAGGDETVRVVDATTGKQTGTLTPKDRRPEWVRFAPGGAVLLAGSNWVERWDTQRNVSVWKVDLLPSGRGLELSPDGTRVAHVSSHGITLLDVETGKNVLRTWDDLFTAAQFSPDGKTLALTTSTGLVVLRDGVTGKLLAQSPDLSGMVSGLTFSSDGKQLAAVAGERWLSWDLTPNSPDPKPASLAEFAVLSPGSQVAVRPDSFQKADDQAEFVNPATGKRISRFNPPETGETVLISRLDYRGGRFSGDGRRFLGFRRTDRNAGGQQTELGLAMWDVATGKRIAAWPDRKDASIAAVSPDGKAAVILLRGVTSRLALWEPDTDRIRWTRDVGFAVPVITFTKGGSWVVLQEVYFVDQLAPIRIPAPPGPYPLLLLDAATGKERLKVNGPAIGEKPQVFVDEGSYPAPYAWAVSPDGRIAAISGFDGTIYLWTVATDQQWCKLGHPGPIHDLAFSPDGKTLAAASLAAPVVVYDLSGTRGRDRP
jgi:RNA polymerase sigma factor (sigma-70 family)